MIEEDEFEAMEFSAKRIWEAAIKGVSGSPSNQFSTKEVFVAEIIRVAKDRGKTFEAGYISSHEWLRSQDVQVYLDRFHVTLKHKIANADKDQEVDKAWRIYRSMK
jgi:hypothetical protein